MIPFLRLREFNGVVQDHTARKVASQSSSDSKRQEEYLGSGEAVGCPALTRARGVCPKLPDTVEGGEFEAAVGWGLQSSQRSSGWK